MQDVTYVTSVRLRGEIRLSSRNTLQSFEEQAQKAHSETRILEFYGATIGLLAYLFIVYCL